MLHNPKMYMLTKYGIPYLNNKADRLWARFSFRRSAAQFRNYRCIKQWCQKYLHKTSKYQRYKKLSDVTTQRMSFNMTLVFHSYRCNFTSRCGLFGWTLVCPLRRLCIWLLSFNHLLQYAPYWRIPDRHAKFLKTDHVDRGLGTS